MYHFWHGVNSGTSSIISLYYARWWNMVENADTTTFCWKEDAEEQPLDELVLWDSFSYHVSATQFPYLKNRNMTFISRRRQKYKGKYLFTLDWAASTDSGDTDYLFSEYPSQHKCGHVIAMDNGNFAIQPNNRLLLHGTFPSQQKKNY